MRISEMYRSGCHDMSNQHTTIKKFLSMVKELLEYDGESGKRALTDWEIEFIESVGKKADEPDPTFSIKQAAKLEQIWQEIF